MKKWDKIIILCRHLSTKANETGVVMGRNVDPSINSEYENDFRINFNKLEEFINIKRDNIDFFSSPALRCQQTTKIILTALGYGDQKYKVDDRLWETDCGSFSGKSVKQLREETPKLVDLWVKHPEKMRFPGGESYKEVQLRSLQWLNDILNRDTKTILAVTHVDIIKMIIFGAINIPISSKRLLTIDPGSITILGVRGEEIVLINTNLFGGIM